jgi:hypothetical protein
MQVQHAFVSIRCPILMQELPFPVITQYGLQVVVGVGPGIAGGTVTHFEIKGIFVRPVDELMSVSGAGFETGAHPRQQGHLALIRDEYRAPGQDVHEFILL